MSRESPPRLKRDAELGAILRAADTPVAPERIAANGDAVKAAIAAGLARASLPLWKIGLPLLLIVGAVAVQRATSRTAAPAIELPREAMRGGGGSAAIAVGERAVEREVAPPLAAPDAPPPKRTVAPPGESAPPPPPPASDLPVQIKLYEDARAAAGRGELAAGIALLDELLRRFPSTQLRAEAELTRAELLIRANRLPDAAAALEALAADAAHRGRRGELLRTLGDVRRKQGDCTAAVDAYTRARAAGVGPGEAAKIERGLARCAKIK
jgi:tetratricopeptide (TPR) repeat protein